MSVVPLKKYTYLEWVTISARVSALRVQNGVEPWSHAETDALWRAFFGEG
jgi:hypothetical protein